jgi:hypothetical protein
MSQQATFYVQFEPIMGSWDKERIVGAKAAVLTQTKPSSVQKRRVPVKFTVDIPDGLFVAPQIAVGVELPELPDPDVTAEGELL